MQTIEMVVRSAHVFLAVMLIALVLLQRGKGAEAGAAFGAGASGTVFGARGSSTFLSKTTAVLATLFFVSSLSLAYISSQSVEPTSIMDRVPAVEESDTAPAATPTDALESEQVDLPPLPDLERIEVPEEPEDSGS